MGCPSASELEALLRGGVSAATETALGAHLAACPECRRTLEGLAGGTGWLLTDKTVAARATKPSPILDQTIKKLETEFQSQPGAGTDEPLDFLLPCDAPGTIGRLGAYEILEKIASGGMGIVLKARDPGLNRVVAIKVLAPSLARNSLARARFIREARAAAAVVHEHIVSIHAVEEFNGLPCIIMQFVKGRTLAERLRATGPMQFEEMLRVGMQAAAGLAAAHAQGLVHRDIKPGNILLENSVERVKLTDFGLARAVDDTGLTRTGQIAGTPEFMAPEQAGSGEVDQRADLFSLGCVLYAMSTGYSPFRGGSTMAVLRRVCDEEPQPLAKVAPALPRWFSDFVHKLLAKNPDDRFQTAAEVAAFLEEGLQKLQRGASGPEVGAAGKLPVGETEPPASSLNPRWIAVGSLIVVILVLALFLLNRQRPGAKPVFVVLAGNGAVRGQTANLEQAITAAQSGDTIELRTDGRIKSAPVAIQGKSLRLRAGPGAQPVITFDPGPNPLLKSDSPLVLEGLAFERDDGNAPLPLLVSHNPPALQNHADATTTPDGSPSSLAQFSQAIVVMQNAPLLVTHCRFTLRNPVNLSPAQGSACLRFFGSPRGELRDCELQSLQSLGIHWDARQARTNSTLLLTNCVHLGRTSLRLDPPDGSELRVSLLRCTLAATTPIHVDRVGRNPVTLTVTGVVFDGDAVLSVPPRQYPLQSLPGLWRWIGQNNLYSIRSAFLQPRELRSLEQWREFWKSGESNSLAAHVTFPKLPLTSGSQTNYSAAQMEFALASGESNSIAVAVGADVAAIGPAKPYHQWKRTIEAQEWERRVASFLSPSP